MNTLYKIYCDEIFKAKDTYALGKLEVYILEDEIINETDKTILISKIYNKAKALGNFNF